LQPEPTVLEMQDEPVWPPNSQMGQSKGLSLFAKNYYKQHKAPFEGVFYFTKFNKFKFKKWEK